MISTGTWRELDLALLDQRHGIRPAPLAVDDPELVGEIRVRLDQQRLEQPLVRLDLPLQLLVLFWSEPWLPLIGNQIGHVES